MVQYLQEMLRLERHTASVTNQCHRAGVLTFLMLAYVCVCVTVEVAEYTLIVSLAPVPDAHTTTLYNTAVRKYVIAYFLQYAD